MFTRQEIDRVNAIVHNMRGGEKELEDIKTKILDSGNGVSDPIIIDDWVQNTMVICHRNIVEKDGHLRDEEVAPKIMKELWKETFTLSGLNPYEAAVIYEESTGEFPIGTSAKEIFRKKRCDDLPNDLSGLDNPEDPKSALLRGMIMRPTAMDRFLKKHSNWRFYDKSSDVFMQALKNPPEDKPWMRPSLGYDVFIDEKGKLCLVNYKSPANDSAIKMYKEKGPSQSDRAAFSYTAEILRKNGIKVDYCALSILDPYMRTHVEKFEPSQELANDVMDACEKFWNENVMTGMTPRREKSKNFKSVREIPPALTAQIASVIAASEMKNQSDKRDKALKAQLLDELSAAGIDIDEMVYGEDYDPVEAKELVPDEKLTGKVQVGGLSITKSVDKELDSDALEKAFYEAGGEEDQIVNKSVDNTKLIAAAREKGLDVTQFYRRKVSNPRFNVSRSKQNMMRNMIDQVKVLSEETLADIFDEVREMVEEQVGHIPRIKQDPENSEPEQDADEKGFETLTSQSASKAPEPAGP